MIPNKASARALQRPQQRATTPLRRVCLFGLESSAVKALGRLLGRRFCLLVARGEGELLSTIRTTNHLDGLVLGARPSCLDKVTLNPTEQSADGPGPSKMENPGPGEMPFPIFAFLPFDGGSARSEMESLGVKWFFRAPEDIWNLAGAIHGELCPADERVRTTAFGTGVDAIIGGAIKYIDQNLATIRSSTDISAHLGVTREHLSRQFTRYTGQTLWDFIATRRVQKAKELLRESGLLIKQISHEVGFNCESSFFRAFVRKTGLTPEGFRKAQRE